MTASRRQFDEIVLELSYNCNFRCIMCGFGKKPIRPEHFMSAEVSGAVIERIRGRTARIRLNGRGESTIHPDFIPILSRLKHDLPGVGLSLFTNASCRESVIDALVEHHVQVFVSMDSPDATELQAIRKGCQPQRFFANLERLAQTDPPPFLVFTLQPANAHRIWDMAEFALAHGCGLIYNVMRSDQPDDGFVNLIIERYPTLRSQLQRAAIAFADAPLLCQIPRQIRGVDMKVGTAAMTPTSGGRCPAIHNELCIGFDGSVMPCNMFNPTVLGNIQNADLDQIINGRPACEFLEHHEATDYCRDCAWMEGVA